MFKMPIKSINDKRQASNLITLMLPNFKKWRRFNELVCKDKSELTYKQLSELKGLDRFFETIIPSFNALAEVANKT